MQNTCMYMYKYDTLQYIENYGYVPSKSIIPQNKFHTSSRTHDDGYGGHKPPPLLLPSRDPSQVESDSSTESVLISKVIPIPR